LKEEKKLEKILKKMKEFEKYHQKDEKMVI
jgi:hypothetical protein